MKLGMQIDALKAECETAIAGTREFGLPEQQATIRLVVPRGWKPPKGFPRGRYGPYHLHNQTVVIALPAARLLRWIDSARS